MAEPTSHTYNFNITMTCGGCSGAVERVLKKLDGKPASHFPTPIFLYSILSHSAFHP